MADDNRGPTLTDSVGMGGVIALDGFDYQVWEGLLRVPAWLTNPTFEAVIFEGLEDIEARFFAPHAPEHRLLERVQAKSGHLGPNEVTTVFERFRSFSSAHPRVTRVQTLVTPRLPEKLGWIVRDTSRVRKARPFYAPFAGILGANAEKLAEDLVGQFGEELGRFIAEEVEVLERPIPSRESASIAFGTALTAAFPNANLGPREWNAAFDALESRVRRSTGVPLTRQELIRGLEREIGKPLVDGAGFPLHIRSDRNGANESALEIVASAFCGGAGGFPSPQRWDDELGAPLDATAAWLRKRDVSRIRISGSYRLTTAFLLGYSFRSVTGFELEIVTRNGPWATDDRSPPEKSDWTVVQPAELECETLVVAVGVIRRPSQTLTQAGMCGATILEVFRDDPLTNGAAAQAAVSQLKAAVAETSGRLRPRHIHFYYAGPAAFAVALGHRWNAMPPTTFFEFDSVARSYVRTATCG